MGTHPLQSLQIDGPASCRRPAQAADRRVVTGRPWLQQPELPAGSWGGGSSVDWKVVAVKGRAGPAGRKRAGPHSQLGVSCPPGAPRRWALGPSAVAVGREHTPSASPSLVARAGSDLPTHHSAGKGRLRAGLQEQPRLPLGAQLPLLSLHHSPSASIPDFRSLCLQDAGEGLRER